MPGKWFATRRATSSPADVYFLVAVPESACAGEVDRVRVVMVRRQKGAFREDARDLSIPPARWRACVGDAHSAIQLTHDAILGARRESVTIPTLAFALLLPGTPASVDAATPSSLTRIDAGSQFMDGEPDRPAKPMVDTAEPLPILATLEALRNTPTSLADDQANGAQDVVVTARRHAPGDPLQAVNAQSFAVTQAVDRALIGPAALAYQRHVPGPVRGGVHNFLNNLHEPDVFINYLLQLKPGKAMETLGRFAINSTAGAAGVFDVAKRHPFNLPRRPNGFGDTFGYYGVKPGPFFFLPVIGPATLRDLVGGAMDRLVLPLAVGRPFNRLAYTLPSGVLSGLDRRAEFDEQLNKLRDGSVDPYVARRDFYLRKRQAEIDHLHGRPDSKSDIKPAVRPLDRPITTEPARSHDNGRR